MKSHELASLADVTVRTLRHYHQVGVLPEPERGSNGYRDYTVVDLVRLLRIKRLAALGIPLERMPAVLDGQPQTQDELLDRLENDIEVEIERLRAQQSLIRLIRAGDAAPDFPPELARFFALFATGPSDSLNRLDREQAILLAHLVGGDGIEQLTAVFELVAASEGLVDLAEFAREFEALASDAGSDVVDALVDRCVAALAPVIAAVGDEADDVPYDHKRAIALLGEHQERTLNPAQNQTMVRLIARLS